MAWIMATARNERIPLHAVEKRLLGYDHAALGLTIMKKWSLPPVLCQIVGAHHEPDSADDDPEAAVIHLADLMAVASGAGYNGSALVPPLSPRAWEILGLPVSALAVVQSQAKRQIREMTSSLLD